MENKQNLIEEDKLFDISALTDILFRRRKIIIFSTSVLFSIFTINTLNNFFRNPIYQGSFSILIEDPIDTVTARSSSIEERLAANNTVTELPTLIQFLKSQHVLLPLAEELGISSWGLRSNLNIVLAGQRPYIAKGILQVSFKGRSKIKVKNILDKLSTRFVDAAKEQRQLKIRSGLDFLDSEYPVINQKTKLIKSKIKNFRKKHNVVNPLLQAELSENIKNDLKFSIKDMKSNIKRLNNIKQDILIDQIAIDRFNQAFNDLGIKLTGSDQELIDKYNLLQNDLASARTKFNENSVLVNNLKQRIKSLYPIIKKQQLKAIDLAIQLNNRRIVISEKNLDEIKSDFQLQPELLSQYEELERELTLSLENLNSLISAKENYQLQLAQKSLPWRIINDPIVSSTPISPNVKKESIRNLLLSFFISIGLALLKESTEKGFSNQNQVEKLSKLIGIPITGSIPYIKEISNISSFYSKDDSEVINDEISGNRFLCTESFRSLATSIRFLSVSDNLVNSILITSAKPSEGKTTITALIAKTLAELGSKVILVDADMRRPAIHKFFKVDNIQGLSNLITDSKITIEDTILKTSIPNLELITAGICPPDPIYLLSSKKMEKISRTISEMDYEYIIFDAPPSETLADADVLSQYTNLSLFIVSLNKVERNSVKRSIDKFSKISNTQIGFVINNLKEGDNLLNDYGYKYNYNNEIYKYYNRKDYEELPENKKKDKEKFNFELIKKIVIKNAIKFKKWIDF